MVTILVVEDQGLLCDSLERFLNGQKDMRVVGSCAHADEALELCRKLNPDMVLMDVVTGNTANGIAAAAGIRQKLPEIKIVVMTAVPEISFIGTAQNAGAHSFIYKNIDSEHLLYVIRSTIKGQGIYPGPAGVPAFASRFSDKELAIIRLVCQGKSRKEIAAVLSMSEGSVKAAITRILDKTGFDSIMKFAVYAVANGFIVPGHSG